MGVRNYLIEGVSGAGKTTVAEELQRRGYDVVHGDRQFAYYGDPQTGERLEWPVLDNEMASVTWGYKHWIWPVDTVKSMLADQRNAMTFFCGGSRNLHHFIALFDAVFVLEVDAETLNRRLVARPEDEFGGKPIERELTVRIHATREGLPGTAASIDATAPIAHVVDDILARCQAADR
jgi:broad-specificity NMP kinase